MGPLPFHFPPLSSTATPRLPKLLLCSSSSSVRPRLAPRRAATSAVLHHSPPSLSLGEATRRDFPILHQEANGFPLVYFDNAATSQKPAAVVKALSDYYESYNSNVHRGIHHLSIKATDAYELSRKKVADFVNAPEPSEIIFTRNATEAINLVAYSWGLTNLTRGDEDLQTKKRISGGLEQNGLYYLSLPSTSFAAASSDATTALQWHFRLGHPSPLVLCWQFPNLHVLDQF